MRLLSLVTAALVLSGLYGLVFEREAVRAISQGAPLSSLFSGVDAKAAVKNENQEILRNLTFSDYASSILKSNELEFMLIASGYSGQLKYMNAYDAYYLFSTGIRIDVNFWGGKYHLLIEKINYHYLETPNS